MELLQRMHAHIMLDPSTSICLSLVIIFLNHVCGHCAHLNARLELGLKMIGHYRIYDGADNYTIQCSKAFRLLKFLLFPFFLDLCTPL